MISLNPEDIKKGIVDGILEDDIYWAAQVMAALEADENLTIADFAESAPTPIGIWLVGYGRESRKEFATILLPKALGRKKKEVQLRDDGRKKLQRFDRAYKAYRSKYADKRECPLCGKGLRDPSVLRTRPKKSRSKSSLPGDITGQSGE